MASLTRARTLYGSALRMDPKYEMPGMAMLVTSDGIELQLHERPPTPGDAGGAISFGVDDVDAMTLAAVEAGGSVIKGPADEPWGERQTVMRDADGHVFCLVALLKKYSAEWSRRGLSALLDHPEPGLDTRPLRGRYSTIHARQARPIGSAFSNNRVSA